MPEKISALLDAAMGGEEDEAAFANAEAKIRDKVRERLGLPRRPTRRDINKAEHAKTLGIDPQFDLPATRLKSSHTDKYLQTLLYPDELERTMERMFDAARLAEQEMGVSTLFLAFGFLEWYESDDSDQKAYAPLLLLPVQIEKEKALGRDVCYLATREGAAEANLSLQKLLEKDFRHTIPNFDTGGDDGIGSIETHLESVRSAVSGLKRWRVLRWLVLGHFAFGRFAMYADLLPANWKAHPSAHPLVTTMLRGTERREGASEVPFGEPDDHDIDDPKVEQLAPLLIHDADASQHSAVIDVMEGKNLVVQGPPGTGKSQTITNIIANALSKGKTVLFLAEKQAALDVVKRRMIAAGVGDFCLELHSGKSSPSNTSSTTRS